MSANNYFLVMGTYTVSTDSVQKRERVQFLDVFPFDDTSLDETREAWANADILAASVGRGRVSVWRLPKHRGDWDHARLVYAGIGFSDERSAA